MTDETEVEIPAEDAEFLHRLLDEAINSKIWEERLSIQERQTGQEVYDRLHIRRQEAEDDKRCEKLYEEFKKGQTLTAEELKTLDENDYL